ncbi:MAG: BrnT family toxin [Selenomonadaceae bacterium]|nr:BrnT family toxin [Selenomonadaceae bacterium]MBQ3725964.1 BrnT family toxin [Selenomonadaceae bacterium]
MSTVEKIIDGLLVEWDEKKAAINKQKHGVTFEDAALVFSDRNRIERHDERHSQDEDRWQVIGMVEDVLFVVYTDRNEAARIIMAREASPKERREYYDSATSYL